MKFTKMHGLGNDYLYVYGEVPGNIAELSQKLSERHFGAGSDGMIYISKSSIADFKMRIFNADGSEAKMCGNGIRTRIRHKPSEGSEEVLDSIRAGYVSYVINTRAIFSGKHFGDGIAIRQCAAQNNITMLTSLDTVRMLLDVLEEVTLGISTIDAK